MSKEQYFISGYIEGLRKAQVKALEIIQDNPNIDCDHIRKIHKAIIEEVDSIITLLD